MIKKFEILPSSNQEKAVFDSCEWEGVEFMVISDGNSHMVMVETDKRVWRCEAENAAEAVRQYIDKVEGCEYPIWVHVDDDWVETQETAKPSKFWELVELDCYWEEVE